VPTDLKLQGKEEIFNIQVTFDTGKIYGKVTANRKFVVYSD